MTKNIVAEIGRLLIEYEIEKQRKQKSDSRNLGRDGESLSSDDNQSSNSILSQSNVK